VHHALKAAEQADADGISAGVLDLRSLNPLDMDAVAEAAERTGRILVAHEDKTFGGLGGEIAAQIADRCFRALDAPVRRVGQDYLPTPFNRRLEAAMQLTPARVLEAARDLAAF
jgi:pyruvate/2-oxoglutarate/acetoin dehydrogenase E1 component